ncbi:protein of unknown function [Taphrina deformans PYCC 5710]|uniref:Uncharacterized protein n=1 Tax=Taphrina deformans (strain PYCC 5710 / ATCC 11124 / CBS 356.35 / IMI 108563 / JCM 9778 / NBRC 8474) TaxID=1097556 RepID=R4XAS6_TAPDE|nr:protein of unknown function [Taphrina deformans PYCC 5710]|eukprot:CCG82629.1 protein of unknown function [Taphrina deformans PYCC 5710]
MSNSVSSSTESGANSAASMIKGIHGIGEQIRGTFNKGVDDAAAASFGNDTNKNHHMNESKHQATLQKGEHEIRNGEDAFYKTSS